jgi:hypothetical protein
LTLCRASQLQNVFHEVPDFEFHSRFCTVRKIFYSTILFNGLILAPVKQISSLFDELPDRLMTLFSHIFELDPVSPA